MKYKLNYIGLLLSFLILKANAQIALTPKTGPGPTAGAGQQWPTTRFIVNGDCVTDQLTGLMWAKNAIIGFEDTNRGGPIAQPNYNNTDQGLNDLQGNQLSSAINNLNTAPRKLCGYSDWRLPNINELLSLINYSSSNNNPAAWLNSQGFLGVPLYYYWSSTRPNIGSNSGKNAVISMTDGVIDYSGSSVNSGLWPVRGGK